MLAATAPLLCIVSSAHASVNTPTRPDNGSVADFATCERALQLAPNYGDAHAYLGLAYHQLGRNQEAFESLNRAFRMRPGQPNDPDGQHSLGMACCELGEFGSAFGPISRALALGHEFAEAYFTLGLVYTELGQNEKAVRAFQSSLRLEPGNANAHLLLGPASHQVGNFVDAVAAYKKSLELNPGQYESLVNLGDAYLQLGRVEEANDILTRVGCELKRFEPPPLPWGALSQTGNAG